jgi:transcriptional regulator with XRE-family HTH domain
MSNDDMRRDQWNSEHEALRDELKKIRLEANLTQEQLAELLGTKQAFISKYERGERTLDFIEVLRVCKACGYKPSNLLDAIKTRKL